MTMAQTQFPGRFNTLDVAFRPLPGDRVAASSYHAPAQKVLEVLAPTSIPRLLLAEAAPPDASEDAVDTSEDSDTSDAPAPTRNDDVALDQDEDAGKENQGEDKCPDEAGLRYCDDYYLGDYQESNCDFATGKLRHLKDIVDKVVREHKTFCVEGHFSPIRRAMKKRGWLEKREQVWPCKRMKENGTQSSKDKSPAVISRMLRNIPVDFLWTQRSDTTIKYDFNKKQIVNRFTRTGFNTKVGLCSNLKQLYWYYEEGVADTLFPRCYSIYNIGELAAFKYDFRMTACISLLKWLVESYEKEREEDLSSPKGKIPVTAVDFAVSRCNEYTSVQNHEDIDSDVNGQAWEHQWDQFLTWYYMAVHNNEKFAETTDPSILMLYNLASYTLSKMEKYWTQMHLDGTRNIWIIKPGANSRGRGIQLMNRMEKIMAKLNPSVARETRYVVQKYIERPLLIYDTKFDIRQWFLVTCVQPMTIWMYRESYLRFCSKCFDLLNFHESVHLCNNAVQCKYKNGKRDPKLPDENMWDCYTFQTYLRTLGKAEMWSQRIYPGMCQSIVGALLASQENIGRKNNCFELFGADFILDEAFTPWLIEINSCPSMCESTSVTARMCAQCLEDVIKVVIDRRTNRKADTGMFELIFKQHIPPAPPYLGVSLSVRGHRMCKADIRKSGSYRGSVKRTNKDSPEDSEVDTHEALPDCDFLPGGEVAEPSENMCSPPDTVNVTPRIETNSFVETGICEDENVSFKLCSTNYATLSGNVKPIIKNIADGVLNLFTEELLCSKGIFSCADAIHGNKSEEAAENEQTSKVTFDKNAAHVLTQETFKNADDKCRAARDTTGSRSHRIPDDQSITVTSQAQVKKNELKNVIKKEACFKSSCPPFVNTSKINSRLTPLQTSPKISPEVRFTSPTHIHENNPARKDYSLIKEKQDLKIFREFDKAKQEVETKPLFLSYNIIPLQVAQKPTLYSQNCHKINVNSNVATKFVNTKQLSSPQNVMSTKCDSLQPEKLINKSISPTHLNKNGTSPTHLNKSGLSPTHTTKTGSPSPTHTNENRTSSSHINKNGTSPIHKKYGEVKDTKLAEIIKEKIMLKSPEHANVIKTTRKVMPVRKAFQEVARKNEKIMVKNILEKNTSVGGAATLPKQYPKQAENTTTVQTKSQMYTISENTEENSTEKLWLHDVKKKDRQSSDESSRIKRHKSNSWKNSDDAPRTTEVYNQWRQKLAQTKASCEELLNTLKIFKESENATKKPKNCSSEKLPFTWNNGPSHRHRYYTNQELPDFKLRASQVSTEDICSGDQPKRLWNTSISYLSMLQENAVLKSRPTENCNISFTTKKFRFAPHYSNLYKNSYSTNCPSLLMLPQIKKKIEMSPDDSNAIEEPVNEFYAIGMSLKALQSDITQTENIILPLGSEHCSEVNSLISHIDSTS